MNSDFGIIIAGLLIAFALLSSAFMVRVAIIDTDSFQNATLNINMSDFTFNTVTVAELRHTGNPNTTNVCAYQNGTLFLCP